MNFTRVETPLRREGSAYRKIDGQPSRVFSWARQYVVDIHRPETWGYVQFDASPRPFVTDRSWPARAWLRDAYYAERDYQKSHGRFAASLAELGLAVPPSGVANANVEATADLFEACVDGGGSRWCIRQDSLLWKR